MLTSSRTLEVVLFAIINFAPFLLLSVYTFYDRMRFSKKVTVLVCFFLLTFQIASRYWCAAHNISMSLGMGFIRLIIFIACYLMLFDIHWGKVLFVELIFANIGNFIIIAAVCFERNVFPNIEHRLYCWHTSLIMAVLHLLITLPYSITIKRYFKPMVAIKANYDKWNYYWLIPSIFYFIWQYQIHGGELTGLDVITNPSNVISLFLINIGSYLIYQIIIQLDSQLVQNYELERQKHFQDVATLELQLLEERITAARHARHDLRHHMIIINDYLINRDYNHLQEYVKQFASLSLDTEAFQFCSHRAINALLLHYGRQAREKEIDFQVDLSISDDMKVSESHIAIILSNLLENAIHGCDEVSNMDKKIIIHGTGNSHSLFFTIDNTCNNKVIQNKQGQFVTTKKTGSGIGMESVTHMVERYNGTFTAEKKDNMFLVSFMLNL